MSRTSEIRIQCVGQYDGWMLLLPGGIAGHVICLDDDGQSLAALEQLAQRVTLVCATEARAVEAVAQIGPNSQLQLEATTLDDFLSACDREPIAGLVLNLLALPEIFSMSQLRRLARHCAPCMGYESFVYLAAANRSGYTRLRGVAAGTEAAPYMTRRQARSLLRLTGVRGGSRVHGLLSESGRVHEVLSRSGYRSHVETGGFEVARELLLSRHASRWFAPAFAVVGHLGTERRSLLEELESRVVAGPRARTHSHRYLASGNKIILSLRVGDETAGRVIVVSRSELGRERRRHERDVLARLHEFGEVANLVPRVLGTGTIAGQPYGVIGEIDGTCVDGPVRDLEAITERATEFLALLGGYRTNVPPQDMALHQRRFGALIELAVSRYPAARATLRTIDVLLAEALRGQAIPCVWEHGDFKIENVMIDRRTRKINGVIDWELAQQDGLPLIDLLCLLVYNRGLVGGYSFERACCELVLAGAWNPHEQRLLARYRDAVPMSDEVFAALHLFFPIHTIARRFTYDMDRPGQRSTLMQLVSAVERGCNELMATSAQQPLTGTEG